MDQLTQDFLSACLFIVLSFPFCLYFNSSVLIDYNFLALIFYLNSNPTSILSSVLFLLLRFPAVGKKGKVAAF